MCAETMFYNIWQRFLAEMTKIKPFSVMGHSKGVIPENFAVDRLSKMHLEGIETLMHKGGGTVPSKNW
jgi:hypothetical protein